MPGVRFTLKKRSMRKGTDDVNLSSYNSDFLSGLFADVAKISEISDSQVCTKRGVEHITEQVDEALRVVFDTPPKRQRTNLGRCLTKNEFSVADLSSLEPMPSPTGINQFFTDKKEVDYPRPKHPSSQACTSPKGLSHPRKELASYTHHDSLAFQLGCVGGEEVGSPTTEAAIIAFPNLPATISDSSCSVDLTRASLIKQASSLEKKTKESFGWFVDLDDNDDEDANCLPSAPFDRSGLAFQPLNAAISNTVDAEVQWAKAADTVDDVLGDFF